MPLEPQNLPMRWAKKQPNVITQLEEQLQALVGLDYQVRIIRERPWASITFSGVRYRFFITPLWKDGPALSQTCAVRLLSHSYDLQSHFVADLVIERPDDADRRVVIEILAINDPAV